MTVGCVTDMGLDVGEVVIGMKFVDVGLLDNVLLTRANDFDLFQTLCM